MFTGIIETLGEVTELRHEQGNLHITVESTIASELKIDQSIAHNGVCLTVVALSDGKHTVTAIDETLQKSSIGHLKISDLVNLERCMQMNGRLDGHIVQGHVDAVAACIGVEEKGGSWEYIFQIPAEFTHLIIEKGSVCLNGISLTAFDIKVNSFKVAIIPFTYQHTNINTVKKNSVVNIEFDIIGKYLARFREVFQPHKSIENNFA